LGLFFQGPAVFRRLDLVRYTYCNGSLGLLSSRSIFCWTLWAAIELSLKVGDGGNR
jgi:hypothetical protein